MTATNTIPNTAAEQAINQRLDAIDRALLDLLPRNERLSLVAQVDARVRELVTSSAAPDASLAGSTACPAVADAAHSLPGAWPMSALNAPIMLPSARRARSRLAISAGLVGIVALVLLFAIPVTYFVATFLGDVVGEIVAIAMLGIHVGIVTLGGLAAVALAVAALVSLKRRRGALAGHGWAIAGLCTGPLPLFAGTAAGLLLGMEVLGSPFITTQMSVSESCPSEACYSVPDSNSALVGYLPAPACAAPVPSLPVPACAAPVASIPPDLLPQSGAADPLVPQYPPDHPPIQPTANEAPAAEPEARPEPPGVPEGEGRR